MNVSKPSSIQGNWISFFLSCIFTLALTRCPFLYSFLISVLERPSFPHHRQAKKGKKKKAAQAERGEKSVAFLFLRGARFAAHTFCVEKTIPSSLLARYKMYPVLPRWSHSTLSFASMHAPGQRGPSFSERIDTSGTQELSNDAAGSLSTPSGFIKQQVSTTGLAVTEAVDGVDQYSRGLNGETGQLEPRHPRNGHHFVNHNAPGRWASGSSEALVDPVARHAVNTSNRFDRPTASGVGSAPLHFLPHQGRNANKGTSGNGTVPLDRRGLMRGSTLPLVGMSSGQVPSSSLALGVEGTRTGEEVVVECTGPRRRSGETAGTAGVSDSGQILQLRRQLEKTLATNKTLSRANGKLKQDQGAAYARLLRCFEELDARRTLEGAQAAVRERIHCECLVATFRQIIAAEKKDQQSWKEEAADVLNSEKTKWKAQMDHLHAKLEEANSHLLNSRSAVASTDELSARVLTLQEELGKVQQSLVLQQKRHEEESAQWQRFIQEKNKDLEKVTHEASDNMLLVTQCRLFIHQVCQPGFSVVKGVSMEPVDKDRSEPTGYVLVPLTVLLHGYTLLPEGERRGMIEHYDKARESLV